MLSISYLIFLCSVYPSQIPGVIMLSNTVSVSSLRAGSVCLVDCFISSIYAHRHSINIYSVKEWEQIGTNSSHWNEGKEWVRTPLWGGGCFSGDRKGEKNRPFEDWYRGEAGFDTFQGIDLSSPEVRLQKERRFSQAECWLLSPLRGEPEIPEILGNDRLLKLDSHVVLKDQISCLS